MTVAYYPGCSLHSLALEYDRSSRLVCQRLGIRLQEVEDWNCCGASAAHSLDHELTMGLASRNLAIVNRMGLEKLTTPCAGCFSRLKTASLELRKKKSSPEEMGKGDAYTERIPEVTHLLQYLYEWVGPGKIAEAVIKPLKGLKLAAYYGCLITRPRAVTGFDDPEQPISMDQLLRALGAETVNWSHKAECCGGAFAASETSIVIDLGGQVLEAARQGEAEAIVVACPMCQANLDSRQQAIEQGNGILYDLPVIYFTQLMGLAFGYSISDMALRRLLVSPMPLLMRKKLA
jgi:heterodisulfide reductase subunit B